MMFPWKPPIYIIHLQGISPWNVDFPQQFWDSTPQADTSPTSPASPAPRPPPQVGIAPEILDFRNLR